MAKLYFYYASMNAGKSLGWPESHLHSEQFLAPTGGEPFDVKLALSGKAFTVPSDLSLLEAIEQQGVDAPYLCRGGACGQCELEVLGAHLRQFDQQLGRASARVGDHGLDELA